MTMLLLTLLPIAVCISLASSQMVDNADLQKWVNGLSTHFDGLPAIMKADQLKTAIEDHAVGDPNGATLRAEIVAAIKSKIIDNRQRIVEGLAKGAEDYHKDDTSDSTTLSCSTFSYNRAKAITGNLTFSMSQSSTEKCQRFNFLNLTDDPTLYNLGVNKDFSTAHVPTNVYDGSKEILMVANWTNALDTKFKENAKDDPFLKWQYFGSREGMFRIYPGVQWHVLINQIGGSYPVDFFDCRSLPWFIMAAACPKYVVILVDKSGSMTGKRVIIANRTITEILLSLTENDYFNVIHVNQTVGVVDPAYNETMIQASMRNVHRIVKLLDLGAKGIANYSLGLTKAFEMLKTVKDGYSKAIFVVGDGMPFAYNDIFKTHNSDFSVRIFAYLIGKEATEVTNMRNMACNNKGYYAHIMTLSDVKENVLKYLPVMARSKRRNTPGSKQYTVWTGPHVREVLGKMVKEMSIVNKTSNKTVSLGTKTFEPVTLFASVSRAAYDRKNQTLKHLPLLGVAGVDIPVVDFIRLTKRWSLGTFGYVFVVNNNGYVLFHPNFRSTFNGRMKPYFQNTDLARVEHPVDATSENGHPTYGMPVRTKMVVDRATGSQEADVYSLPDAFRSAFRMKMQYFFAPLDGTPYSLAVALRLDSSGTAKKILTDINTDPSTYKLEDFATWFKDYCNSSISSEQDGVLIVPYEFCNFKSTSVAQEFQVSPLCALRLVIQTEALIASQDCDVQFIRRVRRDAFHTKDIFTQWKTEESKWATYGIDQVFAIFHSGLVKFYNRSAPRAVSFIASHSSRAMQDDIFQTTVLYAEEFGNDNLYFHPPTPQENQSASSIAVSRMVYTKTGDVPVSVVGLLVGFDRLKAKLLEITSAACTNAPCLRCGDANVDCYIITQNAYILLSSGNDSEAGQFLGAVDLEVMSSMVNNSFFDSDVIYDFQGVCNYSSGQTAFASRLMDPIALFLRWTANLLCSAGLFVAQFFLTGFWALLSTAEVNPAYNVTRNPAWNSCAYRNTVYRFKKTISGIQQQTANPCGGCSKTWKAAAIAKTNLILVAVSYGAGTDRQCACGVNVASSDKLKVNRSLLIKTRRKYPNWSCGQSSAKEEVHAVCSGGNAVSTPMLRYLWSAAVSLILLTRCHG